MKFPYRKVLDQLKAYVPGKSVSEVAYSGEAPIVKLASNENPLGCPVDLSELASAYDSVHVYPHQESAGLVSALTERLGVSSDNLILGNGSDEIIQMLAATFLNPGETMLTAKGTFSVYKSVGVLFDSCVREIPLNADYAYDLDAIADAIDEQSRLIFIANPNNPTGTIVNEASLTAFLDKVDSRCLVVMDEAYYEYADASDYPDCIRLMKTYPNLVVLRTFSKIYGLAGLRVGYGVAHEDVIALLQKIRQPFNINSLALEAAKLALEKQDHIDASLALNVSGKQQLEAACGRLGLAYINSQANFISIFLPISGAEAMDFFLDRGLIIRNLKSFGLENAIRISIGKAEDNERVVACLEQLAYKNR